MISEAEYPWGFARQADCPALKIATRRRNKTGAANAESAETGRAKCAMTPDTWLFRLQSPAPDRYSSARDQVVPEFLPTIATAEAEGA